jgi:alkylation response protein AidB-like acyl-CoA dehydrogenase
MLEEVLRTVGKRGVSYTTYGRQTESHVVLRDVGEAALGIEAAETLIMDSAAKLDEHATRGVVPPDILRKQVRGRAGFAGQMLRRAAETLMSIGGASGFAPTSVLQRHWRDLAMSSRHAVINTNPAVEFYGRTLAGVEPPLTDKF